ncbi:hypothetical protein AALO_G00283440 [Alosa alosa]|uniref:Fibronectin type-III domain-containing protein n=1 Tax=Alosa alosa TaxID=278164 RepID=A0AAV6FN08_9TELE|nr:hypothetical protein AALO_G00283440 [Alosa alosa]
MAWLAVLWILECLTCSSHALLDEPPSCLIPFSQTDIFCEWTPDAGLTNYTLHWSYDEVDKSEKASGGGGTILRRHYDRLALVSVWITASDSQGSHTSPKTHFLPSSITQPPPPDSVSSMSVDGHMEVSWSWAPESGPGASYYGMRQGCDATKILGHQRWTQEEGITARHFQLVEPLPLTRYEFQVRCTCVEVMSPWSNLTLDTPQAAPVDLVDIWTDCGLSSHTPCNITWKDPDRSLQRANLEGFDFREEFQNGTVRKWTVSSNSLGVTQPACINLAFHTEVPSMKFTVTREGEQGLTASWSPPPHFSEHVQEYVLQRRRAGLPFSDEFDWIRVNRDKNATLLKGQFRNCTPYDISLFVLMLNQTTQMMASTVAFSFQCVPPEVPFDVQCRQDSALVSWAHTALKDTVGHMLRYRLQLNNNTVYHAEGTQFLLLGLQPAQTYELTLQAETGAGVGHIRRLICTTSTPPGFPVQVVVWFLAACVCCLSVGCWIYKTRVLHCGYVPDPKHSQLLQELNHLWHPVQFCSLSEPVLKGSQLEVVPLPEKTDPLWLQTKDRLHTPRGTDYPYPDPREHFYPNREHLHLDTTHLSGPDDWPHTEQEWHHIPQDEEDQEEVQEEEERSSDSGFCRTGEYSDSHLLEDEDELRSAEREEEEESDYDGWREEEEEEEEEDSWDLFQKPNSDYERHMPVAHC